MQRKRFINKRNFRFAKKFINFSINHLWFTLGFVFILFAILYYFYHEFFLLHSKNIPAKGGIYTEATIGSVRNLNPLASKVSLVDRDIHKLIFAGLLKYNPLTQKIEGDLAEFRVGDDGKSYNLTIKSSAKFSDGVPVTVEDVFFTYEEIIQNPNFSNTSLHEAFEYVSIDRIDENTILFSLPEQNVFFPTLLTTPILPKHYFDEFLIEEISDADFPFNKNPIGAGPFYLKNIVPEDDGSVRIFLKRNKYYVGPESLVDQVVIYTYTSVESLIQNHNWPTAFTHIPFKYLKNLKKGLFDEYETYEFLLPQFTGVFFNLDRDIVKNLYFRKALYLAFDTDKLLEEKWQRINGPLFFEDIETSYQSKDVKKALRTLHDAGFVLDYEKDVRTNGKGGEKIKLKMITSVNPPEYSRMAQKIANLWEKELDIIVDLEVLTENDFLESFSNRDYDIILFGQNFSQNFDTLSLWHSSQTNKLNFSNLTREDIDLAISEIRFSGARSDLIAFSEKLDNLQPAIIFTTPKKQLLVSKKLKGFNDSFGRIRSWSDRFYGISNWHFFNKKTWDLPKNKSKIIEFIKWIFTSKSDKKDTSITINEEDKQKTVDGSETKKPVSETTN